MKKTFLLFSLLLITSLACSLGGLSGGDAAPTQAPRSENRCGVWIPAGAGENFWMHDPNGAFVYIGTGEYNNWGADRQQRTTPEFVRETLAQLEARALPRDKMYTASIAVPQSIVFHPEEHGKLLAVLDELASLVESGQAVYATYSQVVEIWQTEYSDSPNIYSR